MNQKIAILGGGNIGKAIGRGLQASGRYQAGDMIITRRNLASLAGFADAGFRVTSDNADAVGQADLLILCVQPTHAPEILTEIRGVLDPSKHILASVVAAYDVADIRKLIGDRLSIVRVMPNTAVAIRESMTCLATDDDRNGALEKVQSVFDLLGSTLVIRERLMAAATILGACGIAYMLRYIRAASQGGIQTGFHADEAQRIAAQTARGAASLLLQSGNHPEDEIDKVTTPRGCTIAGLNEMEHFGLSSAVIKGIITSFNEMEKLK